ncbi:MAG: HAD-IC family P-type ATPase, partial [Clostridia bacterium]|nr:HAD-IC family P-type ATPase [Clostridia bacterium]
DTRSGNAAAKLAKMVNTTAAVERNDQVREIPLEEIVVGDLVHLSAGDIIPADMRIITAKDLFVSQSALTGESAPVEKICDTVEEQKAVTDCENLAFMGSNVISGSGIGLVLSVGNDTMFGSIAKSLSGKSPKTSFEKGIGKVSWLLIRFMLVMVLVVLLINGFTKGNWIEALLFAVSVAVGLTPEMLPMIVTAALAKGSVAMSKKKVIVKNLNAIQNLGAIDILCTDKTGTLTQDKVLLEKHMNVHGDDDDRVLRHAWLNSFYQTGLKNLIDIAVIDKFNEIFGNSLDGAFNKVDEIPFDFERRRMSVIISDGKGKAQLITKGAVEEMLKCCSYAEYDGKVEPITDKLRNFILTKADELNAGGMRVIAVAQKNVTGVPGEFKVADESDMVLIGYLAFLDPPKPTTAKAIKSLQEYG